MISLDRILGLLRRNLPADVDAAYLDDFIDRMGPALAEILLLQQGVDPTRPLHAALESAGLLDEARDWWAAAAPERRRFLAELDMRVDLELAGPRDATQHAMVLLRWDPVRRAILTARRDYLLAARPGGPEVPSLIKEIAQGLGDIDITENRTLRITLASGARFELAQDTRGLVVRASSRAPLASDPIDASALDEAELARHVELRLRRLDQERRFYGDARPSREQAQQDARTARALSDLIAEVKGRELDWPLDDVQAAVVLLDEGRATPALRAWARDHMKRILEALAETAPADVRERPAIGDVLVQLEVFTDALRYRVQQVTNLRGDEVTLRVLAHVRMGEEETEDGELVPRQFMEKTSGWGRVAIEPSWTLERIEADGHHLILGGLRELELTEGPRVWLRHPGGALAAWRLLPAHEAPVLDKLEEALRRHRLDVRALLIGVLWRHLVQHGRMRGELGWSIAGPAHGITWRWDPYTVGMDAQAIQAAEQALIEDAQGLGWAVEKRGRHTWNLRLAAKPFAAYRTLLEVEETVGPDVADLLALRLLTRDGRLKGDVALTTVEGGFVLRFTPGDSVNVHGWSEDAGAAVVGLRELGWTLRGPRSARERVLFLARRAGEPAPDLARRVREVREALAQPQELAPLMRREFARALLRAMPRHALAADHLDAWFTPHTRTLEKRGPHMERALVAELDEDSLRLLVVASVDDYDRSRVLEAVLAQAVWREPEVRASVRGLPRDAEPEALVERLQPRLEAALSAWEAFAERVSPSGVRRGLLRTAEDLRLVGLPKVARDVAHRLVLHHEEG
ncbi:MAG: hypothetical protein H6740_29485 [Alphaproteobacteria bacterium]|nr:hypothetical protein [Alphaproteobacteria bacterium]